MRMMIIAVLLLTFAQCSNAGSSQDNRNRITGKDNQSMKNQNKGKSNAKEGHSKPGSMDLPDRSGNDSTAVATFGGGCFWCTEAIFERVKGVHEAVSGYSGGTVKNPSYREVTSGRTGHAEVIRVTYDPSVISYVELLEIFFKTHDPTTLNRQGADVGTQYRSVVFYHDDSQKETVETIIRKLDEEQIWDNSIVTEVAPFEAFYEAEDYHQEYFENNPNQGYCRMVIQPKVEKFNRLFREYAK